jgi:ABC-2 type transport system ATP-binding protein
VLKLANASFGYGRTSSTYRDFDFELGQGKTAVLGPNGAGKSTLMRALATAIPLRKGELSLNSLKATKRADLAQYRKAVAWLPQDFSAFPGLSLREHVAYTAWLKGQSKSDAWLNALTALERADLLKLADASASKLSGGQLKRLGIASALVHDAEVLLLDEPTAGLDPAQASSFRDLVAGISDETMTLTATHQVEDVVSSMQNVVILSDSRIVFQGSFDSLLSMAGAGFSLQERLVNAYSNVLERSNG